jgi:hypothetical protein
MLDAAGALRPGRAWRPGHVYSLAWTPDGTRLVTASGDETVGVHFRGSSSHFSVVNRDKKSLSLSFDHENKKQALLGCKALNLLSAHADPSDMRSVLFAHIVANYLKTPKACFVQQRNAVLQIWRKWKRWRSNKARKTWGGGGISLSSGILCRRLASFIRLIIPQRAHD